MSTRRKPTDQDATKRRKRPAAKAHRNEKPDLEPVMDAFLYAEQLVRVASKVMDALTNQMAEIELLLNDGKPPQENDGEGGIA